MAVQDVVELKAAPLVRSLLVLRRDHLRASNLTRRLIPSKIREPLG
ncbi:MAG: hypothetical protein ACRENL_10745 [Candidatus Dormibacteria bacterium]